MKKITMIIVTVAFSLCLFACGKKDDDALDEEPGTYTGYATSAEEYMAALNTDLNADIMIYGEEQELDSRFNVRRIDKLNEENVNAVTDYGYQAIVIMDRGGTVSLTDEDFDFLWDYTVNQNKDFIYIGKQYLDKLNYDYTKGEGAETDYGLGVYGCFPDDETVLGVGVCNGVWDVEDEEKWKDESLIKVLTTSLVTEFYFNATGESYK